MCGKQSSCVGGRRCIWSTIEDLSRWMVRGTTRQGLWVLHEIYVCHRSKASLVDFTRSTEPFEFVKQRRTDIIALGSHLEWATSFHQLLVPRWSLRYMITSKSRRTNARADRHKVKKNIKPGRLHTGGTDGYRRRTGIGFSSSPFELLLVRTTQCKQKLRPLRWHLRPTRDAPSTPDQHQTTIQLGITWSGQHCSVSCRYRRGRHRDSRQALTHAHTYTRTHPMVGRTHHHNVTENREQNKLIKSPLSTLTFPTTSTHRMLMSIFSICARVRLRAANLLPKATPTMT